MFQNVDPLGDTRPNPGLTVKMPVQSGHLQKSHTKPKKRLPRLLFLALGVFILVIGIGLVYFFFPGRMNILVLGTDDRQAGEVIGRSDTMIMLSLQPMSGKVGMLSIPRDLWVNVPNHGENRINTAHFFAEAEMPGTGLDAAKEVIAVNFEVDTDFAIRVRFDSFLTIVDALGGLEISLEQPTGGYEAGNHLLTSEEALAFVRDRSSSDDFFRMERGQIFITALIKAMISPQNLSRSSQVLPILFDTIETDIPMYLWPRIGLTVIRGILFGIDARVINREMVTPFVTTGGAQVLAPNWEAINPVLLEIFGE